MENKLCNNKGNEKPPPTDETQKHDRLNDVKLGADGGDIGTEKKKRDYSLKDVPSGIPKCPICHKSFASWKGAFGHMRKHPERGYRGFFKPPTFSSSSSQPNEGGEGGSASSAPAPAPAPLRGTVLLDLNLSPLEHLAALAANEVNKVAAFDLNQLPQTHHHEQDQH